MKSVIVRTGKDCISSVLTKAEIIYSDGNKFISTDERNGLYSCWVFEGKPTRYQENLLTLLNSGVHIINNYNDYRTFGDYGNDHTIFYTTEFYTEHDSGWNNFQEWFADSIRDLKNENPDGNYSWFTGNGYYCLDDHKDIFKNGGAIVYYN